MDGTQKCPSIYQGTFSNPYLFEQFILILYSLILIIGLVGNIMTIIIIKYNTSLRTPTNIYLLNLAVSDLMMLMCNLPLEMLEIHHREWPLPVVFCKLRNICAEFFTCSSILTIFAFTCERYFAIVHPVHFHRLSHFRRAENIIMFIWLISLAFSVPVGVSYEIEMNSSIMSNTPGTLTIINNNVTLSRTKYIEEKTSFDECKSCVPKKSVAKILSIMIIITSFCFFYLPMIIIGAIYLFIGQALRHVSKCEVYSHQLEMSISSQSSGSNKEPIDTPRQGSHVNSYSWLKMRARCQARQVVVKTLVAVVIAFFVCYAPLYLQRLFLAIITLNRNFYSESSTFFTFMAYLYVISGITFYFGSVINPILYNVVSNKYRRAFHDLICCRFIHRRRLKRTNKQKLTPIHRSHKQQMHYCVKQKETVSQKNGCQPVKPYPNVNQKATLPVTKRPSTTNMCPYRPNTLSIITREKKTMLQSK